MKFSYLLIFVNLIIVIIGSQVNFTTINRKNVFLSRKKRYVQWPKGSNFVINFTCSKPFLWYQPLTWNMVYEMDIPFAVVTDNRVYFDKKTEKVKRHVLERKDLLERLEDFMMIMGYDGNACIRRLLCEAEEFTKFDQEHSMLQELINVLFVAFIDKNFFSEYEKNCDQKSLEICPISLLEIFLNSAPLLEKPD